MITVKVIAKALGKVGVNNPYSYTNWTTSFNGTFEEACNYFLGKVFNVGLWYDDKGREHEDNLMRVFDCTLVSGD